MTKSERVPRGDPGFEASVRAPFPSLRPAGAALRTGGPPGEYSGTGL